MRRATKSDAKAIAECFYEAVHVKGNKGFYSDEVMALWAKPVTPERIAKFENMISKEDEELYVAEADGHIIGMTIIRLSDAKMGSLYVRPNSYGPIGALLIERMVQRFSEAGLNHMITDASLPAFEFYKRCGFVELGRDLYPGRDMEYVIMRKDFEEK
ncbi:MAG TPA: GNAT family N-acetyltransferase [Alphaproteobacteria bacterium]